MNEDNRDQASPAGVPSDDMDAWYTECPACNLVGTPSSAEHVRTGPPGERQTDWSQPVVVRCQPCGHRHTIRLDDLVVHDAEHTCRRCGTTTSVPAAAAEVVCRSCHLFAPGPAVRADQAVAEQLRTTQRRHFAAMRATLLLARQGDHPS